MTIGALFWTLDSETQAKLMQFQWDLYGTKLNIPKPPDMEQNEWEVIVSEGLDAIDKFMRQAPSKSRGNNA